MRAAASVRSSAVPVGGGSYGGSWKVDRCDGVWVAHKKNKPSNVPWKPFLFCFLPGLLG